VKAATCIPYNFAIFEILPSSEKWSQSEIGIVINDKSQSSIAKRLRNANLLYYTFITQSAGERII